ncbi:nuclease-related domain-containing protein [Diaminobutyricibacter sp. McL0618]|uniref:nuclease-related domain-containing protein n=1 Tax=Leifsonia sp. McL0618 TaxID=3415677 RepID=UPI003CF9EBF6
MTNQIFMRDRPAGLSAIEELLRVRGGEPSRTGFDRLFGLSALRSESRPWFIGALGEITVGRALAELPDPWVTFHSLPVGERGSDVDHLVIGPGGVFVINTKHHRRAKVWVGSRTILVNGRKVPYIRNSEFEAARVGKILASAELDERAVWPIIVLLAPAQVTWKARPENVTVLESRTLIRWLKKQRPVLSEAGIARVATYVDRPETWTEVERDATTMERFAELESEVDQAHMRRNLWAAAFAIACGLGFWVIASGIAGAAVH